MKRGRGRWLGVVVAMLAVGGLAIASLAGGSHGALPAGLNAGNSGTASSVPGLSAGTVVDFVWKFAIVVGLLGGSLWLLRRYAGTTRRSRGRTGAINVVDTIALAQGRAIYVLDLGDRALIIGATQQHITALADVTDKAILARLRSDAAPPPLALAGLARRLNPILKLEEARRAAAAAAAEGERFESEAAAASPPVAEPAVHHEPLPGPAAAEPPTRSQNATPHNFAVALAAYGAAGAGDKPAIKTPGVTKPAASTPTQDPVLALRALAERLRARRQSA